VDINPEAVRNAEMNFAAHGLENASARVSDMFEAVEETFDYIICTPPFFRVAFAGSHQQWSTSTYFVDQLFSSARDYLRPGGCLVVCLPGGYEPDPERLAADGGLELIDRRPLPRRSLGLILHGIPYFQFGMKCQVLSFQAAS